MTTDITSILCARIRRRMRIQISFERWGIFLKMRVFGCWTHMCTWGPNFLPSGDFDFSSDRKLVTDGWNPLSETEF